MGRRLELAIRPGANPANKAIHIAECCRSHGILTSSLMRYPLTSRRAIYKKEQLGNTIVPSALRRPRPSVDINRARRLCFRQINRGRWQSDTFRELLARQFYFKGINRQSRGAHVGRATRRWSFGGQGCLKSCPAILKTFNPSRSEF